MFALKGTLGFTPRTWVMEIYAQSLVFIFTDRAVTKFEEIVPEPNCHDLFLCLFCTYTHDASYDIHALL